jgi:hypothetical protein
MVNEQREGSGSFEEATDRPRQRNKAYSSVEGSMVEVVEEEDMIG